MSNRQRLNWHEERLDELQRSREQAFRDVTAAEYRLNEKIAALAQPLPEPDAALAALQRLGRTVADRIEALGGTGHYGRSDVTAAFTEAHFLGRLISRELAELTGSAK